MSKFADVLKKLIDKKSITISELSKETGIPQSTLSEWSNGREPLFSDNLIKLANYFNVTLEYLLTSKNKEEELISNIITSNVQQFTQIHQGVYRITVEKETN